MKIQDEVKQVVQNTVNKMQAGGGVKQVIWVGAGGSFGGFYGANYFMRQESKKLFSSMYTSGEFVYAPPQSLDKNSLVVLCSMRGTSETIDSAKVAKEHNATTIALYVDESELVDVCDFKIKYESLALDESRLERVNGSIGLCIAMNLLQEVEGYDNFEIAMKTFDLLDPIYRKAVEYTSTFGKRVGRAE